jgi:hypothetical protein
MSKPTHIKEILLSVLIAAAQKQAERKDANKMTADNRRRINEFLERICGEIDV